MTVAQYECEKRRQKCSEMKDCGDLGNGTEFDKCGWCPFKQKGMVKELNMNEIPSEMKKHDKWTSMVDTQIQ